MKPYALIAPVLLISGYPLADVSHDQGDPAAAEASINPDNQAAPSYAAIFLYPKQKKFRVKNGWDTRTSEHNLNATSKIFPLRDRQKDMNI